MIRDALDGLWLAFQQPRRILATYEHGDIMELLVEAERATRDEGRWAVGVISYEAAPAFDEALQTHRPLPQTPLLWFGLYDAPEIVDLLPWPKADAFELGELRPGLDVHTYAEAIAQIKSAIARGDTYQVNYTFPLSADFRGSAWDFFLRMQHNQQARFAAYVETEELVIASASPELFFYRDGDEIWMRPMKGTAPRGASPEEDARLARELSESAKNQAENVMIVDMIRNDLGRIAHTGSVETTDLFRIESYPTLFQMTSTVQAHTDVTLPQLLSAIYPSASITGAPKVRTMQIIRALEREARGVYTGAIGFLSPHGRAQFNVAIRTAVIHKSSGQMRYSVGSGIVWDSTAAQEYDECLLKARVLTQPLTDFHLLETLLLSQPEGYALLERHLRRLCASARYFHFPCPLAAIRQRLGALAATLPGGEYKVRLLLDEQGAILIESHPLQETAIPQRVALASFPVEPDDPFLRHKTTHRQVYEAALRDHPEVDDVILWNRRNELTESARANLILSLGGEMLTPALSSGLLPGTLRDELLAISNIREAVLPVETLFMADGVFLINSVRGIIPAELQEAERMGEGE